VKQPLLVVMALLACGAARAQVPDSEGGFAPAIARVKQSIVPVVCMPKAADHIDLIAGTGAFISKSGGFITAGHVIREILSGTPPCALAAIYRPFDTWPQGLPGNMVWFAFEPRDCIVSNEDLDLARCKTTDDLAATKRLAQPPEPLVFDGLTPPDGTPVAFTGFPLNILLPRTSIGVVAGYGPSNRRTRIVDLVIDKPAWPGISGGPVYLADGKLVGIELKTAVGEGTGMTFARTGAVIKPFLDDPAKFE